MKRRNELFPGRGKNRPGAVYNDLAAFYWEQGERDKAMVIAREGLKKAKDRMDELRAFIAKRAR